MKWIKSAVLAIGVFVLIYLILSLFFPEKIYNISFSLMRKSAGLVKKNITVGDQNIVYLEGGSGPETLVLVHGFGADKDNWVKISKFLSGYHLIIPDLPGFGESAKSGMAEYDGISQAQRLDKFFSAIGLSRFCIGGNSMGGYIAGIYSIKYPKRVKALMLLNNLGVKTPVKSVVLQSIERGINPLLINSRDDFYGFYKLLFAEEPYTPGPIKRFIADKAVKSRELNEKIFKDLMKEPVMFEQHFREFTMPVLIIWGDKDQLIDVSSVKVLENGIKNHTTHILKECGHLPMVERPEETAGYIKSFIQGNVKD
jgi:pimeloyl-ACP methyl ester carboxylesterase